eukprot:1874057-Rhodomonas_salina.1
MFSSLDIVGDVVFTLDIFFKFHQVSFLPRASSRTLSECGKRANACSDDARTHTDAAEGTRRSGSSQPTARRTGCS